MKVYRISTFSCTVTLSNDHVVLKYTTKDEKVLEDVSILFLDFNDFSDQEEYLKKIVDDYHSLGSFNAIEPLYFKDRLGVRVELLGEYNVYNYMNNIIIQKRETKS